MLILVTVNGVVIFIVLFALARLWDTQWRPKTEGELRVERRQREHDEQDSLRKVQLAERDAEEKQKKEESEQRYKEQLEKMKKREALENALEKTAAQLQENAKDYGYDSHNTKFGPSGNVLLEADKETYTFNITSVRFVLRNGVTWAVCSNCIRVEYTLDDGRVSEVPLFSASPSLLAVLKRYQEAVKENLEGE